MDTIHAVVVHWHEDSARLNELGLGTPALLREVPGASCVQLSFDDRKESITRSAEQLRNKLATADLAILLISNSLVHSTFFHNHVLPCIKACVEKDHLPVIAILLEDLDWQQHSPLNSLTTSLLPTELIRLGFVSRRFPDYVPQTTSSISISLPERN